MAVQSIAASLPSLRSLGYDLHGDPVWDPIQQANIAMATTPLGISVELVEPIGDRSPARRFLKGHPGEGCIYHLCWGVDDLDQWWERLRARGAIPVGSPVLAAAFDNTRVAFMFMDGNLVELLEERHGA
ncbi:MAG: methylmalonyl-CoA/ethylmalonyl-CoA epimerase [Chloroflexi bacterium]|jgi:hypothetical protein|nr:MAG: methylmalonyl-CoA/ethylmalonyl-CoA epimerase [Chloroflexota bacterium]